MVSALLGFMAVSGLAGKRNLDGLELRLTPPDEIYDGLPTLARIALVNRKRRLSSYLIEVEIPGGGRVLFPRVPPAAGAAPRPIEIAFAGRGRQSLPAVLVRSRFPVNFFSRYRRLPTQGAVTVFPAPHPCSGAVSGSGRHPAPAEAFARRGEEGEISRIRDYQPGEPLRRVHWKLSARHDRLLAKERSTPLQEPVMIDPRELPGADLEARLRCAAWLVNRLVRAGRPVGLRLEGGTVPPRTGRPHRLGLLARLALYGRD